MQESTNVDGQILFAKTNISGKIAFLTSKTSYWHKKITLKPPTVVNNCWGNRRQLTTAEANGS